VRSRNGRVRRPRGVRVCPESASGSGLDQRSQRLRRRRGFAPQVRDNAAAVGLGALLRQEALAAQRTDLDLEAAQSLRGVGDELGRGIGQRPCLAAALLLRRRQRGQMRHHPGRVVDEAQRALRS
jgi:hypothetical protein